LKRDRKKGNPRIRKGAKNLPASPALSRPMRGKPDRTCHLEGESSKSLSQRTERVQELLEIPCRESDAITGSACLYTHSWCYRLKRKRKKKKNRNSTKENRRVRGSLNDSASSWTSISSVWSGLSIILYEWSRRRGEKHRKEKGEEDEREIERESEELNS